MRILVAGAGAVGSLLGWAAAVGGAEVALVRRSAVPGPPSAGSIAVVRSDADRVEAPVSIVRSPADLPEPPDVIVLAVKQYDLAAVLESLAPWPDAVVVTAQNGIGAEAAAVASRDGPLVAASVTASVERDADGTVRWLRRGGVAAAPVRGVGVEAVGRALLETFERGGLGTAWHDDATAMKWSKLVANLVANATSAIVDLDPVAVYADPGLARLELAQLREAVEVMRRWRLRPVDLPGAPASLLVRAVRLPGPLARFALRQVVGSARGGKDPSLRLAVAAGGPTEAAWMNGAVAAAASGAGAGAPVNAALARLVGEVATDPDRRAWLRKRPDRLVAEVAGVRSG